VSIVVDSLDETSFVADRILITRILGNLIKNGVEASIEGQAVTISCSLDSDGAKIAFNIHSTRHMSDDVKKQVFTRSFSTKGASRGIGTYGAKLFTERYLNGSISFCSDKETGTSFCVELPVSL